MIELVAKYRVEKMKIVHTKINEFIDDRKNYYPES